MRAAASTSSKGVVKLLFTAVGAAGRRGGGREDAHGQERHHTRSQPKTSN